jgi:hypothetical protein
LESYSRDRKLHIGGQIIPVIGHNFYAINMPDLFGKKEEEGGIF